MTEQPVARLGPIYLIPGVTRANALAFLIVDLIVMGVVVFVNVSQVYLMNTKLGIPEAEQGTLTGNLGFWSEVTVIALAGLFGVLADKTGRRGVMSLGLVLFAAAYVLFPLAQTADGLLGARLVYAVGVAAATCMLTVVVHDYPQEKSRGKLVAASGLFGGFGVAVFSAISGNLPGFFTARGATDIEAGYYLHAVVVAICLIAALYSWFGMQAGVPVSASAPRKKSLAIGLKMAARPRIALLYFSAFAARGDLVVGGTFIVLWGSLAGKATGMPAAEALSAATLLFVISSSMSLVLAPVMGFVLDRFDRLLVLAVGGILATAGFAVVGSLDNPLAEGVWPAFVFLGVGQASCFYASQAMIGQEAPAENRGAVIGTFSVFGAVGVLVASGVGGRLFDNIGPGAPFMMVASATGLLAVAALLIRFREPSS